MIERLFYDFAKWVAFGVGADVVRKIVQRAHERALIELKAFLKLCGKSEAEISALETDLGLIATLGISKQDAPELIRAVFKVAATESTRNLFLLTIANDLILETMNCEDSPAFDAYAKALTTYRAHPDYKAHKRKAMADVVHNLARSGIMEDYLLTEASLRKQSEEKRRSFIEDTVIPAVIKTHDEAVCCNGFKFSPAKVKFVDNGLMGMGRIAPGNEIHIGREGAFDLIKISALAIHENTHIHQKQIVMASMVPGFKPPTPFYLEAIILRDFFCQPVSLLWGLTAHMYLHPKMHNKSYRQQPIEAEAFWAQGVFLNACRQVQRKLIRKGVLASPEH